MKEFNLCFRFYVYLTEPASKKVIVDYTTSGVSAIAGEDFELAQGVLEIEKGETTGLISLTILGDVDPEGTESFGFLLAILKT